MIKYYIYAHKRKTDGTVFYIGKGSIARSKTKNSRSKHWTNTVKKHGYDIVIVKSFTDEKKAYEYEIKAIKILRWIGCRLCNIADGGEGGLSGHKLTSEHKQRLRLAKLGKKQSKNHALKSASAKKGKKQPRDAVEKVIGLKRKKVINSLGEIFESATQAAREMSKKCNRYASQGNLSACANGIRNEAFGLNWSYDTSKIPEDPKPKQKPVKNITLGVTYRSLYEAADVHNIAYQCISLAINKGGKCKGFEWSY